jgi:hypothetical protein
MPRRNVPSRTPYSKTVHFTDPQLKRLQEKVNEKGNLSEIRESVERLETSSSVNIDVLAQKVADLENASAQLKSSDIVGNGSNSYQIGFTATSEDSASYDVSINGLVKSPVSDYTIDLTANSIQFSTAIASGDDIVITQRDGSSFSHEDAIDDFLNALYN